MTYNKKLLYLVVNGIEISITSSPRRICILEDYLMENHIPRNAVAYELDENDFSKFQGILEEVVNRASYRKPKQKK